MKLKTPLRYPGGKSRAVKYIMPKLPKNIKEYREPFLGGASIAIAFTQQYIDIPLWVNDIYYPLYCFWITLKDRGEELSSKLLDSKNKCDSKEKHRKLFEESKEYLKSNIDDIFIIAEKFYIINKCSFSGLTESSSFSPQASINNFTARSIKLLPKYSKIIKKWKITNLDYSELIEDNNDIFIFLDPPYNINTFLYGRRGSLHKGFDHKKFYQNIIKCKSKCMITYNYDPDLYEWYKDKWNAEIWDLTYTMRSVGNYNKNQKNKKEMLLTNYDVVDHIKLFFK